MHHPCRPTFSPEHGVYVVTAAAFATGIALAGTISRHTATAAVLVFCALQAEHALGIVLRCRGDRTRYTLWAIAYGSLAGASATWLARRAPDLLWVYLAGAIAMLSDGAAIARRRRKGAVNELIGFAAACTASLVAYASIAGRIIPEAVGLWALDATYFGSSVFVVKLRKPRSGALRSGAAYHLVAAGFLAVLVVAGVLPPRPALVFLLAPLKFGLFATRPDWFGSLGIRQVGLIETAAAAGFVAWVALTL
jgi:hypothetical protein